MQPVPDPGAEVARPSGAPCATTTSCASATSTSAVSRSSARSSPSMWWSGLTAPTSRHGAICGATTGCSAWTASPAPSASRPCLGRCPSFPSSPSTATRRSCRGEWGLDHSGRSRPLVHPPVGGRRLRTRVPDRLLICRAARSRPDSMAPGRRRVARNLLGLIVSESRHMNEYDERPGAIASARLASRLAHSPPRT